MNKIVVHMNNKVVQPLNPPLTSHFLIPMGPAAEKDYRIHLSHEGWGNKEVGELGWEVSLE